MLKGKVILIIFSACVLVLVMLGLFLVNWPWEKTSSAEQELHTSVAVDLGVTYVSITSGLSAYHDMGVDSGALVTEVVPNSPADRAGVKVGDIILSFNGSRVEEKAPLLGMMRACPADSSISLEVQSGMTSRMVEIVNYQK